MSHIAAKVQRPEKSKEVVASRIWLHYYNWTLYEKGLITEKERNRMDLKIDGWTGPKRKV